MHISSWKYAPFEQMPSLLFNPQVLAKLFFPCVNAHIRAFFYFSSVIDFVSKHVHTKLLWPHLLATAKVLVSCSHWESELSQGRPLIYMSTSPLSDIIHPMNEPICGFFSCSSTSMYYCQDKLKNEKQEAWKWVYSRLAQISYITQT